MVLPKETLSSIAKRYQVSISSIQLANNLKDSNIFIHQRLIIPTNKNYSLQGNFNGFGVGKSLLFRRYFFD